MSLDVYLTEVRPVEVEIFDLNITHNMVPMAKAVGIYHELWSPDLLGYTKAGDLIWPLRHAITKLLESPEYFKEFNPPNGWGNYDTFLAQLKALLRECQIYPSAKLNISK